MGLGGNFSLTSLDRKKGKSRLPKKERQVFVAENLHVASISLYIPVWVFSLASTEKPPTEMHM